MFEPRMVCEGSGQQGHLAGSTSNGPVFGVCARCGITYQGTPTPDAIIMPLHTRIDILAETEGNDPTKGTWMFEAGACTETSLDRPNTERDANVAAYAAARDAAIPTRTEPEGAQ